MASVADTSALALAARLRRLDQGRLEALLRRRAPSLTGIEDHFDLADALLTRENLHSALVGLDRHSLALIATVAEQGAIATSRLPELLPELPALETRLHDAVELALLDVAHGQAVASDPLRDAFAAWPSQGLPNRRELVGERAPGVVAPAVDEDRLVIVDRLAAERAFATVNAMTELLIELQHRPARALARGRFGLPDSRRIAEVAGVDSDTVPLLHEIAAYTQLIALDDEHWVPTAGADLWLQQPRLQRWRQLVEAWLDRLSPGVREVLADRSRARWDEGLLDAVEWLYPGDRGRIRSSVVDERRVAEALGISADQWPSSSGSALVLGRESAATAAMASHFPAEVDRVYVQHDLTVIAPGPLAAELDVRMRRIAEADPPGIASSYRITAESLTRGLSAGEDEASIRGLLEEASLTGVPQPLDYLIGEAVRRYGTVRVRAIDTDASADDARERTAAPRTTIRSDEPALLAAIAVDRRLAPLALRDAEGALTSSASADTVLWLLSDNGYPAALEDDAGAPLPPTRRPSSRRTPPADDPVPALARRLQERATGEPPDTERAWFARQLDIAVKARQTVRVTVRMPDGTAVDYVLEPTAMAAGRLRARDRRVDVERTLPLSHITAVAIAPEQ